MAADEVWERRGFTLGDMIHPGTNELSRRRNEMTLPLDLLSLGSASVSTLSVTSLESGETGKRSVVSLTSPTTQMECRT